MKATILFIILLMFPQPLMAKRVHPEKWYQEQWCEANRGKIEVRLDDGTRCDCVTETHAIEFDFGNNWAEAIGQSGYYASKLNRKAGIVLILESGKDQKFWIRLINTIEYYNLPIDIWRVGKSKY
ncbi:hypothetical protein D3OALGA1CA_5084 [Olavius algarvensis associated proteobacterium Delta 3]|nr:hypothetical protein D3OALGA1CA_5084 [Olavius algarvensis associated proteobacterium Delta 3]